MATTIVGAVKYDATIDLAKLRSSVAEADKLVEQSYKDQSKNAQNASKEITKTSSKDAQTRVETVKREAQETANTISKYTPQIQRQFLTVERANNQVTSATVRAQNAIQKYGVDSDQATKATSALSVAVQKQSQQQSRLQSMLDGTTGQTGRFSNAMARAGVVAGATAAALLTVLNSAINVVSSSISSAVSRIDTLNNAPRVIQNLGYSLSEGAAATQKLDKGIRGLPTSLDSATSALLSIASASGKSIDYATDLTIAFNNMALAGGKGPVEAQRALTQFTQALGRGKFEMDDFNTLAEVMPAQLNQVAKVLLGAEANTRTLGTALGDGTLSIEQFNDEIIRLNKTGGSNFASFEKQAKDATSGIGTSYSNMQTAISRGVATVIEAIGSDNISNAITRTGKAFESTLKTIASIIKFLSEDVPNALSYVARVTSSITKEITSLVNVVGGALIGAFRSASQWITDNSKLLTNLGIIIGSLLLPRLIQLGVQATIAGARMASSFVVMSISAITNAAIVTSAWVASAITTSVQWVKSIGIYIKQLAIASVQTLIAGARMAAGWLLALGPIGIIVAAVAGATALIINNWDSVSSFVGGVWQNIQQAASSTFEWIKTNWPLILAIITGPIGLATLAIIRNFDTIRQAVGNVWNWIQGVFGTIGSVAATIIKVPVNAIISFAERTLNGFIGAINGVINNINNIPGVNIGRLGGISVPRLAEGGIVQARPGGILANIGEGGKDEAVIPLDRLEKMMSGSTNNQNVTVNLSLNGVMTSSKSDERAIAERIAKLINEAVKAKTGKPAIAGI